MKKLWIFFYSIGLFLWFKTYNSVKRIKTKKQRRSYTPPPPFKEWIKGSGYENESIVKQQSLYNYFCIVHEAAETESSQVLPNFDILHASIVVAFIISNARTMVTLQINSHSQKVLDHPYCRKAFEKASTTGIVITCSESSNSPFLAWNDTGMMRIETCPIQHSAVVVI